MKRLLVLMALAALAFAAAVAVIPPTAATPWALGPSLAHAHAVHRAPRALCGNIFDASGSLCGPHVDAAPSERTAPCEDVPLVGILQNRNVAQAMFAGLGVVEPGALVQSHTLLDVDAERAILVHDGQRCEARLFAKRRVPPPQPGALSAAEPFGSVAGRLQVPRATLRRLRDLPALLGPLRVLPLPEGARINGVRPGTFPARLGLLNGDLIVRLQGRRITPDVGLELYGQLESLSHISAVIRRDDAEVELHVDIVDR